MGSESIILFDGICNLCNASINFIIRHDKNKKFKFSTLQSSTAQQLVKDHEMQIPYGNSFVLIENGKVYTRSTAALKVARDLDGIIKVLYGFIIVPPFIRNFFYDIIASKRYKWFGKSECMVPTPSLQNRFLN